MKPIIKYRGGKSKEIQFLMRHIPEYTGRYIEPFFGGGALYFHIQPNNAIINDINTRLMHFYLAVKNNYLELKEELSILEELYKRNRTEYELLKAAHPNDRVPDANEALYYHLRDMYNGLTPLEYSEAALYYFINKTAYSGMLRFNQRGEYNVPYGRYKNFNTDLITDGHHQLLQNAIIQNTDYSNIFEMALPEDFVFLDPPYDCVFSDYGNPEYRDGFNEIEHRRLAHEFYALPCRAMMVIGLTPLIEELYANNIIDEYNKNYAVNIRNRFRSEARHVIITNFY